MMVQSGPLHRRARSSPGYALDVGEGLFDGHHVGVFGLDVYQVCLVRLLRPVPDALAGNQGRVAVLQEVYGGRPDTAAGGRSAHDDGVHPLRDQDRGQVRAEEGRSALFEDHRLVFAASETWIYLDPLAADEQLSEPGSFL